MRQAGGEIGAAGGLGERDAGVVGQREGRVRGEDGGEARGLHLGAVAGEGDRAVLRIRPDQALGDGGERGRAALQPDIGGEPPGAVGGGEVRQSLDQGGDGVDVQQPLIHPPADRQGDEQDGVAEGVLRGGVAGLPQAGEEFLERVGRDVRHAAMVHGRRGRAPGGVNRTAG